MQEFVSVPLASLRELIKQLNNAQYAVNTIKEALEKEEQTPDFEIQESNLKFRRKLSHREQTNYIVLHHADAENCTVEQIHQWHLDNGPEWSGFGYQFAVYTDGQIFTGRPIDTIGAACYGHNYDTINIVCIGDYSKPKDMSKLQFDALVWLITHIKSMDSYKNLEIKGHKELSASECPGRYFPLENVKRVS